MNKKATISIPEEILFSLRESESQLISEMKKITAMKYFNEKKLSIGQSSILAEMSEENFIKYLSQNNVSIFQHFTKEDIIRDIDNA